MLVINIIGAAIIALIVWWFWLYKPQSAELNDGKIIITVENGIYTPSRIEISADTPRELTFIRKDASPCAETVMFPAMEISEALPLNKPVRVVLPALAAGEYVFHCQMQMYKGVLKVSG